MSLQEFSEKYFNFKNNWHHLLFYDILSDNVRQIEGVLYRVGKRRNTREYVKKTYNRHILILSPRFSSKSTIISFIYPLYLICQNPNIRILVVSANEDIATSFVRQVLHQLENNEKLLQDYHYLIPKKYNKWGEKAFIVKRDTIEKDPTMAAAGILGKIVSKRADVIILDDIIDLDTSRTVASRKKVMEWFDNVLYPILEPEKGRLVVVGTSWFKGDLYDEIYQNRQFDIKIKLKSFIYCEGSFYVNKKEHHSRLTRKKEPLALNIKSLLSQGLFQYYLPKGLKKSLFDGSLWSDFWSYEKLQKQRSQIGESAFCRQYLNEPVSSIDSFFSKSAIDDAYKKGKGLTLPKQYPPPPGSTVPIPHDLVVAMGVDLAVSTAKTSDYSAIAIWGLSPEKTRYLLYLEKFKKPLEEIKQKIIDLYHLYNPIKVIVESNVFQDIIRADLGEEIDVEGIKTTAVSKFDEVRGLGHLQTLFDQRKIIIPFVNQKDINDFYNELLEVRLDEKSHTPDTVMASWFALQFLKNYDELITKSSGFFTVEGIAWQSKKLVHPSQYAITPDGKIISSYNSIFYSFIPRDEIFKRKYFLFATYIKSRVFVAFFDKDTGEFCCKIDATITPTFAAQWLSKRQHLFSYPTLGVYKDHEGTTLLFELQKNQFQNLLISYPREDDVPVFEAGLPPLPYILGPAFEYVKYKAQYEKEIYIKDKPTLLEFSRIISVSGKEVITSKQDDIPQRAITFALGFYLFDVYNKDTKEEKEKKEKKKKIKYQRPHYTIFNYT